MIVHPEGQSQLPRGSSRDPFARQPDPKGLLESQASEAMTKVAASKLTKKLILVLWVVFFVVVDALTLYLSHQLVPVNTLLRSDPHPAVIIKRTYALNKVYNYEYKVTTTSTTTRNSNFNIASRIEVTYHFLAVVHQMQPNSTILDAALQKRHERHYELENGTLLNEFEEDNSTIFYDILKHGYWSVIDTSNNSDNSSEVPTNISELQQQETNDLIKYEANEPVPPLFRFELKSTGKIGSLTFPRKMNKTLVGFIRCVVKMFSPILIKEYYTEGKPITKVKSSRSAPRNLQDIIDNSFINDTDASYEDDYNNYGPEEQSVTYSEAEVHDYETDDTTIGLAKASDVTYEDPSQKTNDSSTQLSNFGLDGELSSSTMQSNTKFLKSDVEPSDSFTVVNPDVAEQSNQTCDMQVLQIFESKPDDTIVFVAFLQKMVNQSLTYNFTVEQTMNYVIKNQDFENPEQVRMDNQTRLLQQRDGSFTIFDYSRQLDLLRAQPVGFSLNSFAYFYFNLGIYELSKNSLRKIPKIAASAGFAIQLGWLIKKISVFDYYRQFPPITLKLTLEKIQKVFQFFTPSFLGKLRDISQLILNGDFENLLLPNILNVLGYVDEIEKSIILAQDANSPLAVLNKLFIAVFRIGEIAQTKGTWLLNPQAQFISSIETELLNYYNTSFFEALAIFNAIKQNLTELRALGSQFLDRGLSNFTQNETRLIAVQIRNLIPNNAMEEYLREMQKARRIIDFVTFVQTNSLNYVGYIQQAIVDHETNLIKLVKQYVDLYFRNQTNTTDNLTRIIDQRILSVETELSNFRQLKENVNISNMNSRVRQLFGSYVFGAMLEGSWATWWTSYMWDLEFLSKKMAATKQHCCRYKKKRKFVIFTKKVCAQWNAAFSDLEAEKFFFNIFRDSSSPTFLNLVNKLRYNLKEVTQLISDTSLSIPQLYEEMVQRVGSYQYLINPTQFSVVFDAIRDRLHQVYLTKLRMGCGDRYFINVYMTRMQQLLNFVAGCQESYRQSVSIAKSSLQQFNLTVYNQIVAKTVIIDSVPAYMAAYKSFENISLQFLSKTKALTQTYNPREFAQSLKVALDVYSLYQNIKESIDQLCINKEPNRTAILGIREEHRLMREFIATLSNNFLRGELDRLGYFLNYGTESLYNSYLALPFCQNKAQFEADIRQRLMPDWDNFTIILELYQRMMEIKNYTLTEVGRTRAQASQLVSNFYTLFTPQGYFKFIYRAQALSQQITELASNASIEMSRLREEAKTIFMFQTASKQELQATLDNFAFSQFTLDPLAMYANLTRMVKQSILTVELLSFDVIAFVVASRDVIAYFETSIKNFAGGIIKVLGEFRDLCQAFLDLNSLVSQQHLNNINYRFNNIILTFNGTVFPSISENATEIQLRYRSYKFSSPQYRLLFLNSMAKLNTYATQIHDKKEEMFAKMRFFLSQAIKLIDNLQIGSLNEIFQLANTIKAQFQKFFNSFPQLVAQIFTFKSLVTADFRKVFSFKEFFKNVQTKIEKSYEKSVATILSKIQKTKGNLEQNSKFYGKFKNSTVSEKIDRVSTELQINFLNLWAETNTQVENIDKYLREITGSVSAILDELAAIRDKAGKIRRNVEARIQNIKNQFQVIRKKLFNIQELFFISLRGDLSVTVTNALTKISEQLDGIVLQNLGIVSELSSQTLKGETRLMRQMIRQAQSSYDILKVHKGNFITMVTSLFRKIDTFVQDELVSKFQKFKDAMLFIKSLTNLEAPVNSIELYSRTLREKTFPIFRFSQPILTPIGIFVIGIELDFRYSLKARIMLMNFRSVSFQLVLSASLNLQLQFGYGIPRILQFGFFMRGSILKGEVIASLNLVNVIPLQLVAQITGVAEIESENQGRADFAVDVGFYGVELTVGFYIKHIWIEIIWIRIKLCFDFFIFSFCISFRLPIGFRFTMKRYDWGYTIPGVAIMRKNLFRIVIFRWG